MNEIEIWFEKLYLDVCEFSKEFKKISFIIFPLPFIEGLDKKDPRSHQKERLAEILSNIQIIGNRISNDIRRINYLLENSKGLNKEETEETNRSFGDLLTEYEIIFSKYKSYINKYTFNAKFEEKIKAVFEKFINSMTELDKAIYKYNSVNMYKILQPYEESELGKCLQNYGFSFVKENEISNLIVYR